MSTAHRLPPNTNAGPPARQLRDLLDSIQIFPRRLVLRTPGVRATVPMLRGVWGAALHGLDRQTYQCVFEGQGPPHERAPAYVLRPGPPISKGLTSLDWILINPRPSHDRVLLRAWDVASGMGLGPERQRFFLEDMLTLSPEGQALACGAAANPWPLSLARWPCATEPHPQPCRLSFPAPLRLIRDRRLVERPTLADVTAAALRRLASFLDPARQQRLSAMAPDLLETARRMPAGPWQGQRLDLVRYSGRQKTELELRGVAGCLDLPQGAGELGPLLAAAQWLHIGKGTTMGMGQVVCNPPDHSAGDK